jgi:hypothetical protein
MHNGKISVLAMLAFIIRLPNGNYINCDQIQTIDIHEQRVVAKMMGNNHTVTIFKHQNKTTQDQFIYDFVDRCNSGVVDYE